MVNTPVFLSVEEVAGRLKIGQETIRVWIRQGKLKARKIGKSYRISEEDYREYIKS